MKIMLFATAMFLVGVSAVEACTNMKRLPVFDYRKHASGEADFAVSNSKTRRSIVVHHSGGISKVDIRAKRGAKGRYTRSGSGAPLPIGVSITENLCKQGWSRSFTKKLHARLPDSYATSFYAPFKTPQNQRQAIALAQTVLRATYCPNGDIKLDPNFRYVDSTGSQPVTRTAPVAQASRSDPFDEIWTIRFTCSEWRAAK